MPHVANSLVRHKKLLPVNLLMDLTVFNKLSHVVRPFCAPSPVTSSHTLLALCCWHPWLSTTRLELNVRNAVVSYLCLLSTSVYAYLNVHDTCIFYSHTVSQKYFYLDSSSAGLTPALFSVSLAESVLF